ncbi:hypothetical protein NCQ93_003040 [Salmonella enterica]|nr:hypothetical protein [Salmonella enterica subsp. enterica serovar Fluntern]EEP8749138.1 hypothetical protein [Salmonella enterica subsp. enterica serovar Tennessee]EFO6651468.1 hypothetical protein [Salmonella enterica]EFU6963080.1 hypothetical protein [Salmonella enterica subsp. enterica serovar Tennessee]EFY4857607.1 hypothetical protein [Salmonella enterica]
MKPARLAHMVNSKHFFVCPELALDRRHSTTFRARKTSITNSSPGNTDSFTVNVFYFSSSLFPACTHIAPAKNESRTAEIICTGESRCGIAIPVMLHAVHIRFRITLYTANRQNSHFAFNPYFAPELGLSMITEKRRKGNYVVTFAGGIASQERSLFAKLRCICVFYVVTVVTVVTPLIFKDFSCYDMLQYVVT